MSTLALEIGSDGLRFCSLPDPLNLDGDNEFETHFVQWPVLMAYNGGGIPRDMEERLLTYSIVAEAIEDADHVIVLVSEDVDRRRVGISEVALEAAGCSVDYAEAHPQGPAEIIRKIAEELIQNCPRPIF